jgi:hypothetical protein
MALRIREIVVVPPTPSFAFPTGVLWVLLGFCGGVYFVVSSFLPDLPSTHRKIQLDHVLEKQALGCVAQVHSKIAYTSATDCYIAATCILIPRLSSTMSCRPA